MIPSSNIRQLIKSETFSGFLIIAFFLLALLISNIDIFDDYYNSFIFTPISLTLGGVTFNTILINLVNDGIMSFFFLLIGLEMKYNLTFGEYVDRKNLILPSAAAIGGVVVPALIYIIINYNQPTIKGWAISIASDTAFILAILTFFKGHISLKLRSFVIVFSLIDDALALIILAVFYTNTINIPAIAISLGFTAILALFNFLNIRKISYYIIVGILLWISMVESGIHGTLCGVIVALFIPIKTRNNRININYQTFENKLQFLVHNYILPLFVFINSGIVLSHFSMESLFSHVSLGIILGLFLGKQIGIFGFSYLVVKMGFCSFPYDVSKMKFYAISMLGGIGFTLSFFIGGLAFEDAELDNTIRTAIIIASLLSGVVGTMLLKKSIKTEAP